MFTTTSATAECRCPAAISLRGLCLYTRILLETTIQVCWYRSRIYCDGLVTRANSGSLPGAASRWWHCVVQPPRQPEEGILDVYFR